MKSRLLLTALMLVGTFGSVYAVPEPDPEHSFRHSEIVIEGRVLLVDIISEPVIYRTEDTYYEQSGIAVYEVEVEKSLKNPENIEMITVAGYFLREPHPMAYETYPYEVGQKVLMYLQENTHGDGDTDLIISSSTSKIIDESLSSLIPEPEQDRPMYENCGPGTILQDGVCMVNSENENSDTNTKWGDPYNDKQSTPDLNTILDYDYDFINMIVLVIVGTIGGISGGIIFAIRRKRR